MIGIDITRVSRFQTMSRLDKFLEKFNVDGDSPMSAAKTWACLEAITKARGVPFETHEIKISFPKNSAPQIIDPKNILDGEYCLSLSHEDDLVIAVAVKK